MNIENVKMIRRELSMILNTLPVSPTANGRYTALAKTNLEEGRMWLGRILGLLGDEYPYSKTNYAPTDTTKSSMQFEDGLTNGDKIDLIRKSLGKHGEELAIWYTGLDHYIHGGTRVAKFKLKMSIRNAWTGIEKTKMWLGMEKAEVLNNGGK